MPEPIPCRHIHIEGRQCGSPALRGQKLCYHHNAALRPLARRAGDPLGPILPDPEDLPAVQRGLAELLRLVARNLIDAKQAKLLFAILTEAGTNLARIDRARARRHALALSEACFAARHPEATAKLEAKLDAERVQNFVVDLVNDSEFGPIAPAPGSESGPDADPRPESPFQISAPPPPAKAPATITPAPSATRPPLPNKPRSSARRRNTAKNAAPSAWPLWSASATAKAIPSPGSTRDLPRPPPKQPAP